MLINLLLDIFGKDIFGFETSDSIRKLSGPFGDELIAGGYIQRFSIFTFFLIPFFFNSKNTKKYLRFILSRSIKNLRTI